MYGAQVEQSFTPRRYIVADVQPTPAGNVAVTVGRELSGGGGWEQTAYVVCTERETLELADELLHAIDRERVEPPARPRNEEFLAAVEAEWFEQYQGDLMIEAHVSGRDEHLAAFVCTLREFVRDGIHMNTARAPEESEVVRQTVAALAAILLPGDDEKPS